MNFQDFFRNFIGLSSRHNRTGGINEDPVNKFRNPPWGDDPDEDDDFDELYTDYRRGSPGNDFGFNIFTGDVIEMHKYFEQQMNEMMRGFTSFGLGAFDFPSGIQELPDTPKDEHDRRLEAPRDRYLKSGLGEPRYSTSRARTDTDLDHRINNEGIGALFKKDIEEDQNSQLGVVPAKSVSRSFTSRVIISNGGRVEEKLRVWKSDGTERETVRRNLGDEGHSVTTLKDSTGQIRHEEELVNIDKDSLSDFNKKWSLSSSGRSDMTELNLTPDNLPPSRRSLLSCLWGLFS